MAEAMIIQFICNMGVIPLIIAEIEKYVEELLEAGFIRVSNNPYSSSLILVRKKKKVLGVCAWITDG